MIMIPTNDKSAKTSRPESNREAMTMQALNAAVSDKHDCKLNGARDQ